MSRPPAEDSASRGAAARVARNTGFRAAGELVGKLATVALLAVLARELGAVGLGAFVFALAWCEIATTPIEMGFDRYFLRRVARDRDDIERYFYNVLALKLLRAVPVIAVSWVLVTVLGYDETTRMAVYLLTGAFLLDTFTFTVFSTFNGVERADLIGITLATQRIVSAGLGLVVLLAGQGVAAVAAVYLGASALAFALAIRLLARHVRLPALSLPRGPRRDLRRRSVAFAGQELLAVGIGRLDVVLLSALATQAVVGYYGAAYRMLEATLFISVALQGAFSAMYTYLHHESDPTITAVFQRSLKLSLVLLVPCAVVLGVLPGPILELLFGESFDQSSDAMRALAPTIVLLGVVLLASSLISSRLNPRILVTYFAVGLAVNVAGNLLLIPPLGAAGAALAMLATELVLAALMLRTALRALARIRVAATVGAPLLAGLAMAVPLIVLEGALPLALAGGAAVYVAAFVLAERRLAPADLDFLRQAARKRMPRVLVGGS